MSPAIKSWLYFIGTVVFAWGLTTCYLNHNISTLVYIALLVVPPTLMGILSARGWVS